MSKSYAILDAKTREIRFQADSKNYLEFLYWAKINLDYNLSGLEISGADFSTKERQYYSGGCDVFSTVNFSGAKFVNCHFSAFLFSYSNFSSAQFYNCKFERCNSQHSSFFDAEFFAGTKFIRCTLNRADFRCAQFVEQTGNLFEDCEHEAAKNIIDNKLAAASN